MTSVVIGFRDAKGTGPAFIVAGPETSQEDQIKMISRAKAGGQFPKGCVRLDFCLLETRMTAINTNPQIKKNIEMKNLLLFISALALSALPVKAQSPIYAPNNSATFTVTHGTGTNVGIVIDCRKQASVGVQIEMQASTATTQAVNLVVVRSVDGVTYESGAGQTIGLAAVTSTTKTTAFTNFPSWGCGYAKILYATNNDAGGDVTNAVVRYGTKIGAP